MKPSSRSAPPAADEPELVRFGRRPRIEHWLLVALVATLAASGLPQLYPEGEWAQALVAGAGGPGRLRGLHRWAGLALLALLLEHLAVSAYLLVARGGGAMLPRLGDFGDAIGYLRYCLGLRPSPPLMDRFDYRQKFHYWALVLGLSVVAASGLILWFPLAVVRLLPGQVVAAARVAHGSEALLTLLTVVTWHLYSVLLSPEVFPLDRTMFSGRISWQRMEREHPLELARLRAAGGGAVAEPGGRPGAPSSEGRADG